MESGSADRARPPCRPAGRRLSNVDAGGANWDRVEERVRDGLRNHFSPEFLNRVDDIIVLCSLSRSDLVRVVDLQLVGLEQMLRPVEGSNPSLSVPPLPLPFRPLYYPPIALRCIVKDPSIQS